MPYWSDRVEPVFVVAINGSFGCSFVLLLVWVTQHGATVRFLFIRDANIVHSRWCRMLCRRSISKTCCGRVVVDNDLVE